MKLTQKNLEGAFGSLLRHDDTDVGKLRELARMARGVSTYQDVDHVLDRADEILGGYGIEAIRGNWVDHYYQDIVALYVNMGDVYVTTILFNTTTEAFSITTVGDWVEYNTRRYGIL